jgi:hypothetical protein
MLDPGQFWVRYKDNHFLLVFVGACDLSVHSHGPASAGASICLQVLDCAKRKLYWQVAIMFSYMYIIHTYMHI